MRRIADDGRGGVGDGRTDIGVPAATASTGAVSIGDAAGECAADAERCWISATLQRLSHSAFRAKFVLTVRDRAYARAKGRDVIAAHARDLLRTRVGDAEPRSDGRQTPWRGHPVFTAQHATATCCRGCIAKWHGIPKGRALTDGETARLADLVMAWIDRDLAAHPDATTAPPVSAAPPAPHVPSSPAAVAQASQGARDAHGGPHARAARTSQPTLF